MLPKEAYLDHTLKEVEELAARVNLLKSLIGEQTTEAKRKSNGDLEKIRNRFAEFKHRVLELEDAPEDKLESIREATELAWQDVKNAVDSLLSQMG
jgi:phosphoserine phosphatase